MSVVVVGLHERDAPLDLLEQLAVNDRDLPKALKELCDSPHLSEAVLLSTCMRTEVYAVLERFHDGLADIRQFFESRLNLSSLKEDTLDDLLMVEYDEAAAKHLFSVASGVDSPVLGEGEILRQVKDAAERALAERASGPVLAGLFNHATQVGKRARTETNIARGITSLSHVAVAVAAEHVEGSLANKRVMVVGAGEMGEGIATALSRRAEGAEIVIVNRDFAKATAIANEHQTLVAPFNQLHEEIRKADIAIFATTAEELVLDHDALQATMALRSDRPLLVIDAAMPRDVEPTVASMSDVTLVDVADLSAYAEREMQNRQAEIARVDVIIHDEIERYNVTLRARTVAPVVSSFRDKAEALRIEELERHRSKINALDPAAQEVIEALSKGLVAKFMHEPTVQLKDAGGTSRGERLAEALRTLFDL